MTFEQAYKLMRSEGLHVNLSVNDSVIVYFRWVDPGDDIIAFSDVCLLSRNGMSGLWSFSCPGPGYSDYVRSATLEETVAFVLRVSRKLKAEPSVGVADAFIELVEPEHASPVNVRATDNATQLE